jgi:hypothetical protein
VKYTNNNGMRSSKWTPVEVLATICFMLQAIERVEMFPTQQTDVNQTIETIASLAISSTISEPNAYSTDIGLPIFQALVVSIGVIGTLANGTVLLVLFSSTQSKKQTVNMLFINQISLDLFSCFWLVIVYSVKISNLYLTGTSGFWICVFIVSENFIWFGLLGSVVNLACIAVERYAMIVHPIWHKTHFRPWMTYVAMTAAWLIAILQIQMSTLLTSVTVNGQCFQLQNWASNELKVFHGVFAFLCFYAIILVIIVYCYARILVTVRKQSRISAAQHANNPHAEATGEKKLRIQMNIVKTMILVSGSFAVCWLPSQLYVFLQSVEVIVTYISTVYYVTMLIAFFNACLNPFLYAANYEVVRRYLHHLATCDKNRSAVDHVLISTIQTTHG